VPAGHNALGWPLGSRKREGLGSEPTYLVGLPHHGLPRVHYPHAHLEPTTTQTMAYIPRWRGEAEVVAARQGMWAEKYGLWLFVFEGNGGNPSANLEIIKNRSRTEWFYA